MYIIFIERIFIEMDYAGHSVEGTQGKEDRQGPCVPGMC